MPSNNYYGTIEIERAADDNDETMSVMSTSTVLSSTRNPQFRRSHNSEPVASAQNKKLLDLEALIGMCVISLKVPELSNDNDDIEKGMVGTKSAASKSKVGKRIKSIYKGTKKRFRTVISASIKHSALLIPKGINNDDEHITTTEKRQCCPCVLWCFQAAGKLLKPLFDDMRSRVVLVPAFLVAAWVVGLAVVSPFETFLLKPIIDLLLPKLALVLCAIAVLAQAWICSLPLASSLAKVLCQLQQIIDLACHDMTVSVPSKISKLLQVLKIPSVAADNLCRILFVPFGTVLATIFKIIPKIDTILPAKLKEPKPLVPIIFAGLLAGLFFGQVLLILTVGSMLNGTIEILVGVGLCLGMGWVATQAQNLVVVLIVILETVLNGTIQFLLRKLLPVSKLQKTIDYTYSLVPKPSSTTLAFKRTRKRKKRTSSAGASDLTAVV